MRSAKVTGFATVILTAACAVHVTTDANGAQPPIAPLQVRTTSPAVTPSPTGPTKSLGRATPSPAATPTQPSAIAPNPLQVQATDTINLSKIQAIKARNPKNCGFMEVSPGNWVHVDCAKYQPAAKAIPHLSARKLRLVKSHKQMFVPLRQYMLNSNMKQGINGSLSLKKGGIATGAGPAVGGPAQTSESFPSTVDHRTDNVEGPIKNQGGVGSCTAHSLSTALDNAAIRAGNLKPGDRNGMTSPLHVWSRYGLPNMGAAADGNIAQPVAVYTAWPQSDREACMLFQAKGSYAEDCAQAYGVKAGSWRSDSALMAKYNKSESEGVYKIASIEKLETEPPNMEELLGILAGGADIWAAFLIDGSAWSNRAMKNAVIPNWGEHSGGHAVVISGYRETPSGKQFLIHNSWGESWGEKGYAWISEAMVNKNLYFAYKVKITNGVKKEDLTDDDCAPDELVDLGTGLCAIMCADDSRPNNGCKK